MATLDLDELYAWIDTIPLSRPKRNISRDFADGVLVAEVIAYYLPKLVDLHNYPAASSLNNRKINWETLNRKVLAKIGVRVSDETIQQLVDAKQGVIEYVLVEIRNKLEALGVEAPSSPQPAAPFQSKPSIVGDSNRSSRSGSKITLLRVENSNPSSGAVSPVTNSKSSRLSVQNIQQRLQLTTVPTDNYKYNTTTDTMNANEAEKTVVRCGAETHYTADSAAPAIGVMGQVTRAHQIQGQIAVPTLQPSRGSIRAATPSRGSLSGGIKTVTSEKLDEPPAQIIYRGHKMIPLQCLDEKEKEVKCLEVINRSLTLRIFRLETLVNIKDQRVEDLTHQLQSIRSMYEQVTDKSLKGITN